jgi:diacylglycerol O-acyltransferase / wax synthase
MAANERERISAVDTAWLRMDRPSNLMMICGVLLFRERLALARLKAVLSERFLVFRRFRQRAVESSAAAFWEIDPSFDLDHHVVRVALAGRAGTRELEALVARLISTPLDPARPMWQFHLVDNFAGGSAVVARIHHCYADGIALVRVMLSMTDSEPNGPAAMPFEPRERKSGLKNDAPDDDVFSQLMAPFGDVLTSARKIGGTLVEKGVAIWNDPVKAVGLAERGSALTVEIAKLALMAQDSPTRFKGTPGVAKRVAWAEPLSLPEVKTIGKALGASVNDVLLACVSGALRSYLLGKGDPVDGVMLRALVPVNLRPMEKAYRLGNQFGLVFLDLPIGIENPVERLYRIRANMSALKGSYQPILALGVLAAMGAGPKMLQEKLLAMLARNATAVMTNVPGPQTPLFLAGGRIESLMFWVPQSGDIGMGVSIISYNDSVQFGVVTDRSLCPDPKRLTARFGAEFEKLVLTTLMSPWPRDGELDPEIAAQSVVV